MVNDLPDSGCSASQARVGVPDRRSAGAGRWGCALALCAASLGVAQRAHACVRPSPIPFEIDPALQGVDIEPPSTPVDVGGVATRASGEFCRGGTCVVSSCGSSGNIRVEFSSAAGDAPDAEEVGYQLRFVEGVMPEGVAPVLERITVGVSPLQFEVPFDDVVSIDATFQLVAIDRAGNESAPSAPFHVSFDGCTRAPGADACLEDLPTDAACNLPHTAPQPGLGLSWLALVAAGTLVRRWRR
jgi:hypothetical protein